MLPTALRKISVATRLAAGQHRRFLCQPTLDLGKSGSSMFVITGCLIFGKSSAQFKPTTSNLTRSPRSARSEGNMSNRQTSAHFTLVRELWRLITNASLTEARVHAILACGFQNWITLPTRVHLEQFRTNHAVNEGCASPTSLRVTHFYKSQSCDVTSATVHGRGYVQGSATQNMTTSAHTWQST